MTYRLSGTIADDKLSGTAKTELNGEQVSREWDAVRGRQAEEKDVAGMGIAGAWTLHLSGPDGQNVELPMELAVDGKTLKGRVARGDGRWMKVEDGEVDGDSFRFKVSRDRDDGGSMTYELTGKHTDGTLSGSANAKLGENEISVNWHAVRKQ